MAYGDKRDYRKIDIFVNGEYVASTTWAARLSEAVYRYGLSAGGKNMNKHTWTGRLITARFAN